MKIYLRLCLVLIYAALPGRVSIPNKVKLEGGVYRSAKCDLSYIALLFVENSG